MFVAAGIRSVASILQYIVTDDEAKCLVKNNTPKGLISFGKRINKINTVKYIKSFRSEYRLLNKYSDVLERYVDSGGFQVATMQIPRSLIDIYIDTYVDFLESNDFDWAFSLDIPNNLEYNSIKDLINLNEKSLSKIANSSTNKDKILFVVHFRTLDLFEIWTPLMQYLNVFNNVAIGGLVVAQSNMRNLPFIFSVIGLLMLLTGWKKMSIKKAKFHVLGNSTFKDVILYTLIRELFKEEYKIDLDLTYDSSNLFKKFQLARFFTYWDEVNERSAVISAKTRNLDRKYMNRTHGQVLLDDCNAMAKICNFDYNITKIYDENTKFDKHIEPFSLLIEAYQQSKYENYIDNKIKKLYKLYMVDRSQFIVELSKELAKIGTKNKRLAYVFTNTLDILKQDFDMNSIRKLLSTYSVVTDSEFLESPSQFVL